MSKALAMLTGENAVVVGEVEGRKITRGEMSIAFDAVANPAHWKMPVDKKIDLDAFTMALVREAVIFYTGSVPTFEPVTLPDSTGFACYRVRAAGYYLTCGA